MHAVQVWRLPWSVSVLGVLRPGGAALLQDANLGAWRPVGAASRTREMRIARGLLVYTTTQQKPAFSDRESSRVEQALNTASV